MSRAVQEVRRANASKFGRHNSPRRAPTKGAPTNCQSFSDKKPASSRQRPLEIATAHYDLHSSRRLALGRAPTRGAPGFSLGVWPWEGHPQGVPLPIVFSRRLALGRAPTRGAPTDCLLSAFWPGEGTHKGCPYRLSSLGVLAWGGHPQGVPLPIVFSRRFGPGEGTHKGCPYRLSSLGVLFSPGGRAPTRGAPTDCFLSALPIVFSRRLALGRAPTRGAPTDCFLSAF